MAESKGNETPVVIFGKEYPSIRIAYNALKPDVTENTIRQRLKYKEKYGWTDEEAFGLVERKRKKRTVKKNKDTQNVENKNKESKMRRKVIVDGVEYPSTRAVINAYKADEKVVYNRVSLKSRKLKEELGRELTDKEKDKIIEDAVKKPKQITPVVVDGVEYRSPNDYFTKNGKVKLSTFNYRRSLEKPLKYCAGVEDKDGNPV